MKTSTIVIVGIGAYIAWWLTNLGIGANTVQFLISGLSFEGLTTLEIQVTVQNVSNANATVNSMAGNVLLNGLQLANISYFSGAITVAANAETVVPIQVDLSLLNLPGDILNVINGGGNVAIEIQGNANVNGIVLPFDSKQSFNYNGSTATPVPATS